MINNVTNIIEFYIDIVGSKVISSWYSTFTFQKS